MTSPLKVDGAVHVCTCRTRSQLTRRFDPTAWTLPSPIARCHFYSIAPARLPATLPHGPLRAALGGTVTPRPSTARPSPQQPSSTSLRALGGFIPAAGRACFLCHSPLSRSYYNRSFCYRLYAALSGPCTSPRHAPSCFLCHSPLSRSYYYYYYYYYYYRSFCYRLYAALSGPCTSPLQVPLVVPTRLYYATLGCREARAVLAVQRAGWGLG